MPIDIRARRRAEAEVRRTSETLRKVRAHQSLIGCPRCDWGDYTATMRDLYGAEPSILDAALRIGLISAEGGVIRVS